MRNTIRRKLLDDVSELKNVYQPNIADQHSELPYAVVKFGSQIESTITGSFNRSVEIWVYIKRSNYNILDDLIKKCISSLNNVELTTDDGTRFALELTGISPDGFYDSDLQALTKNIFFTQGFIQK